MSQKLRWFACRWCRNSRSSRGTFIPRRQLVCAGARWTVVVVPCLFRWCHRVLPRAEFCGQCSQFWSHPKCPYNSWIQAAMMLLIVYTLVSNIRLRPRRKELFSAGGPVRWETRIYVFARDNSCFSALCFFFVLSLRTSTLFLPSLLPSFFSPGFLMFLRHNCGSLSFVTTD